MRINIIISLLSGELSSGLSSASSFEEMIADNGPEFGPAISQNKRNHPFEAMLMEPVSSDVTYSLIPRKQRQG